MDVIWFWVAMLSLSAVVPSHTAAQPPQRIVRQKGDNGTFQCPTNTTANLTNCTVYCKRVDNNDVVVSCRGNYTPQQPAESYRNRASLSLRGGNLTVGISLLNQSDSGLYRCFIKCRIPKLDTSCDVDLVVETVKDNQLNGTKNETSVMMTPSGGGTTPRGEADAAKKDWIMYTVFGVVGVVGVGGVAVLVVLIYKFRMKLGIGEKCKRRPQANSFEMEALRTSANGDLDIAAAKPSPTHSLTPCSYLQCQQV